MSEISQALAELVKDVQAYLEWEALCGARAVPVEPVAPAAPEPLSPPPRGPGPVSAPLRPAAGPPAFGAQPPRPPGAGAPAAAPSRPAPAPPPRPAAAPGQLGIWAQHLPDPAVAADTVALAGASTLDDVRRVLGDCRRCGLCEGRRSIVFGEGDPKARLFIVGEGPGETEDETGRPFVGAAGQMLDRMVSNVLGLDRSQVYIGNVVKCRPPNNRNPDDAESRRCLPFLQAQLRAVAPEFVLVLGTVAVKALFGPERGITAVRGRWQSLDIGGRPVAVMPTFHPAYLLRQPDEKKAAFDDLKLLRAAMDGRQAR